MNEISRKTEIEIMRCFHKKYTSQTAYNTYNEMILDALIYNKSCHLIATFNEFLIWEFSDEFLKREYKLEECLERLPKFADFYKNYLTFFCTPMFCDFHFNDLIQDQNELKAEVYYNQNFAHKRKKDDNNNNFNIIENYDDDDVWFEPTKHNDLLFTSTVRKKIEKDTIVTISNINSERTNNDTMTLTGNDVIVSIDSRKQNSNENTVISILSGLDRKVKASRVKKINHLIPSNIFSKKFGKANSSIEMLRLSNRSRNRNITIGKSQTQNEKQPSTFRKSNTKSKEIDNIFKTFLHKPLTQRKTNKNFKTKNQLYLRNSSHSKNMHSIDNLLSHNIISQYTKSKISSLKSQSVNKKKNKNSSKGNESIMKLAFSLLMHNNFTNSNCNSQRNNRNNSFLRINSFNNKNVQNINININNNINITTKRSRNKVKSCEFLSPKNGTYEKKKINMFNTKTKLSNVPFSQLFSSYSKLKIRTIKANKINNKNMIYHYNKKSV